MSKLNDQEIKYDFIDLGCTVKSLSLKYSCCSQTIRNRLTKMGIKSINSKPMNPLILSKEDLTELYSYYTIKEISKITGESNWRIYNWLCRYQIPRKSNSESVKMAKSSKYDDTLLQNKVKEFYLSGLTGKTIASQLGMSRHGVYTILKILRIIRNKSEAAKLRKKVSKYDYLEVAKIRDLYQTGNTTREVGEILGVPRHAIGFIMEKHKIPRRNSLGNHFRFFHKKQGWIKLKSSYEIKVANFLERLGYLWYYESIKLVYKNKDDNWRRYTPDFYLPDLNLVLEVKGAKDLELPYKKEEIIKRGFNWSVVFFDVSTEKQTLEDLKEEIKRVEDLIKYKYGNHPETKAI